MKKILERMLGKRMVHARVILKQKEFRKIRRALLLKGGARYLVLKGVNRNTAYLYLSGRRRMPLTLYLGVAGNLPNEIWLKMAKNLSAKIRLGFRMKPELAYIAGAMRDGWLICVKNRPIGIGLEQKDAAWLKKIARSFESLFGLKPKIVGSTLVIYSELLARYFHEFLGMPFHSQEKWGMPKAVENSGASIKKAFLEGFLDAEGYVKASKDDPQVVFYQNNRQVLESIRRSLVWHKIKCGKVLKDSRSKNHRLSICEKSSVLRFSKIFKSRLSKKRKRLEFLRTALL